uniref:Putative salivary secreted peptide n=1 Tax=Ixodes ricinus TaxID=34613 RepID=V5GZ86_IXORI
MAQSLQLHLLLLVLIPIPQCGGSLIDLEDIVYQFLLQNCSSNERLVTYDVTGDNGTRGPNREKSLAEYPPVTIKVGPVSYGKAQVESLQLSAVYVQLFHNNQTNVPGKAQISEQVQHEDEYIWTVNKGLEFTTKLKFSINVPLVYQFSSEISTSVKTSTGSTTVETRTTKQWIKQDVTIPPGATIEAKWFVNKAKVVVPWVSEITLNGYVAALFETPDKELTLEVHLTQAALNMNTSQETDLPSLSGLQDSLQQT